MFPYFPLFGFQIPSYTVLSFLGFACAVCYIVFVNRSGRLGRLPGEDILYILILAFLGVIVGGKVLYVLVTLPQVLQLPSSAWENPEVPLGFLFGGMVFYGGLLGAILPVVWYCRKFRFSLYTVAGIAAPALPLFHTFGRTGCFLTGCCWGRECTSFGHVFQQSPVAPNGVPLFPTQLLEAGWNALLFVVLATLAFYWHENAWRTFPLYLLLYSTFRFILEFFRGDAQRGVLLFSTSQWISLAILLGLAIWFIRRKKLCTFKKE